MYIHWIKNINNERTVCGIDTIKVAEEKDRLSFRQNEASCPKCKNGGK